MKNSKVLGTIVNIFEKLSIGPIVMKLAEATDLLEAACTCVKAVPTEVVNNISNISIAFTILIFVASFICKKLNK